MDSGIISYSSRNLARAANLENATMYFMQYFIDLGDDLSTSQSKVTQLSTEVAAWLYPYVLGNTQPLVDAVNSSGLPFMDSSAKSKLIELLQK
jgi:hypothetical protein